MRKRIRVRNELIICLCFSQAAHIGRKKVIAARYAYWKNKAVKWLDMMVMVKIGKSSRSILETCHDLVCTTCAQSYFLERRNLLYEVVFYA